MKQMAMPPPPGTTTRTPAIGHFRLLRRYLQHGLWLALFLLHGPACAMSVTFINPGKSNEIYWTTVTQAMQSAAHSLGITLEVLYAEREREHLVTIAHNIMARPASQHPDFVIITNDYAAAPLLLKQFDEARINTFVAFSGISDTADRAESGHPRQRFRHWLGSLEPHAEDAGYLTAKALIAKGRSVHSQASDGKLHLIAISGDRSTPASRHRSEGMRRAVTEAGDVVIDQEVFAEWSLGKATEKASWLYPRYPDARLVWSGSDQMAFGAMQAWEQRGGHSGKDAWFSGVNTSVQAMEKVRSGELSALAGGHFIAGAWALVMLYDYAHGHDFAHDEGLELDYPMFTLFTPIEVEKYLSRYADMHFDSVDFRKFSKALNPRLRHYDFHFQQLLQ